MSDQDDNYKDQKISILRHPLAANGQSTGLNLPEAQTLRRPPPCRFWRVGSALISILTTVLILKLLKGQ